MFCPGNDLILKGLPKIAEIVTVSCHSHNEVPELFRIILGCAKGFRAYHVELHMVAAELEI